MRYNALGVLIGVALACLSGCGNRGGVSSSAGPLSWADLLQEVSDVAGLPQIDGPGTVMHSSHDRSGGNSDWSALINQAGEGEWVSLVQLEGPGVVTRFWMTGWSSYSQRLRILFDGETEPRFEGDILSFFQGEPPFAAPFARHENFCAYWVTPLPYAQSFEIQIQRGSDPNRRTYFQLQEKRLLAGSIVESLDWPLNPAQRAAWDAASAAWDQPARPEGEKREGAVSVDAETEIAFEGPGRVTSLALVLPERPTPQEQGWLRESEIQVFWDGVATPAVHLPLGDFFGQMGFLTGHQSLFTSLQGARMENRLPMPFRSGARIRLLPGKEGLPAGLRWEATWIPGAGLGPQEGYLHGQWNLTQTSQVGPAHRVIRGKGAGRFVGCWVSADSTGLRSWWGLEGDESFFVDGALTPVWQGTGLEDYFNGGWYYQAVLDHPHTGLVARQRFRTVQYRWHTHDPVTFTDGVRMQFERGGTNNSPMRMESVGWAYLAENQAAPGLPTASWRAVQAPRKDPATAYYRLLALERLGDWAGAEAAIRGFPADKKTREWLALREWFGRWQSGVAVEAPPGPEAFGAADVKEWARQFDDLYHGEVEALLIVSSRAAGAVYFDGEKVGELQAGATKAWAVAGSGVCGFESRSTANPTWFNAVLVSRSGHASSDRTWRYRMDPSAEWFRPDAVPDETWNDYIYRAVGKIGRPTRIEPVAGLLGRTANIGRSVEAGHERVVLRGQMTLQPGGLFESPIKN